MQKKQNIFINLIRLLAMLLIINSHSDILFPANISFLATGGAIGNELFFLVSGYLYNTSNGIKRTVLKRYFRLYIPIYIMNVVLLVFGKLQWKDCFTLGGIFDFWIWPASYWFISAIFIDGILLHILVKLGFFKKKHVALIGCIVFMVVNIVIYIIGIPDKNFWIVEDAMMFNGKFPYKCIYSFFVFGLGFYVRQIEYKAEARIKRTKLNTLFIGAVVGFVMFYGVKFLLNRNIIPMKLQIVMQPITVLCVLFIFLWILRSDRIKQYLDRSPKTSDFINIMGTITLESFLIQYELIWFIDGFDIPFPANYIVCVVSVCLLAWIFHIINDRITSVITKFLCKTEY